MASRLKAGSLARCVCGDTEPTQLETEKNENMVSKSAEPFTLTALLIDIRTRLLETLSQPASAQTRTALNNLWRTCLTVHDSAETRRQGSYVRLMEMMTDAIADYHDLEHPETVSWDTELPSIDEIRRAETAA